MITRQLLKEEIENLPEEHLLVLYRIILALESSLEAEPTSGLETRNGWREFVAETYGCMAEAPIERGDQSSIIGA